MAKILLVDDDSLMVRMYQKKLENDGYEVKTGSNGEECLKLTAEFKPDLILLDIMMPIMNGLDTLEKLKSQSDTKNIPVILLTNVGSSTEDAERGLNLGAVAYLTKAGNRPAQVVEKVKEILSGYVREVPKVKANINP